MHLLAHPAARRPPARQPARRTPSRQRKRSQRSGKPTPATARERIFTHGSANTTTIGKAAIDTLPQGNQTAFDRVVLQLPGVSQDSAASGDFHIRNEHANVQYRINGILLPDGVSGFSQVLDSSFIRTLTLVDGALPAEYGLHTAGLLDITSRNGADNPGSTVSLYGGSRGHDHSDDRDRGRCGTLGLFLHRSLRHQRAWDREPHPRRRRDP